MIIEFVKDTKKRQCTVCNKLIHKKDIIVKYESVIDCYKNTRMWFAHINCVIKKLSESKKKMEEIVPKFKVVIERKED